MSNWYKSYKYASVREIKIKALTNLLESIAHLQKLCLIDKKGVKDEIDIIVNLLKPGQVGKQDPISYLDNTTKTFLVNKLNDAASKILDSPKTFIFMSDEIYIFLANMIEGLQNGEI